MILDAADGAYAFVCAYAGLFGLLFGSFMNVCIARMPEDRSVVHPRSACPCCGAMIQARDNIPVLSWLILRGRCRSCAAPISPLYPTVEALFGVLAVLLFRHVVPDLGALDAPHLVAFGWYFYLLFALVALTFIDLRHAIIPDAFSIHGVPVGVGGAALLGVLGYVGAPSWQQALVGALAGGVVLLPLMGVYWLIRRVEGMGWGDVKLLALIGSYFGAMPALLAVLLVAAMVGSAVGIALAVARRGSLKLQLPFGPFLALGALVWLHGGATLSRVLGWDVMFQRMF